MFRSLSARLVVLTVVFVMIAEVFIFVPSIAQFRRSWLEEHLASAQLASLAVEAAPDNQLSPDLQRELLANAMVKAVILKRHETRTLMLSEDMPPRVVAMYDLRTDNFMDLVADALGLLVSGPDGAIQVTGTAQEHGGDYVAIIIDEQNLYGAMLDYAGNIVLLSIVISLVTAALIFLSLFFLFVRPMQRLTGNMVRFREAPEEAARVIDPSGRRDEIGTAEQVLHDMQDQVRQALAQKTRLANLGEAVAKINHDLRNMLASAQLVSDRLAKSDDPGVRKFSPTLVRAIDRAIELCTSTLKYGRAEEPKPRPVAFELSPLVEEVGRSLGLEESETPAFRNQVPDDFIVDADPEQLFRALQNLVRNAQQALDEGAGRIDVSARRAGMEICIDIEDTGPGLPDFVRDKLFKPFQGSARDGGSGLGLVNVREIARAHGGDVFLVETGERGTVFRITLPECNVAAQH